jgi:hypothetical protein
LGAFSSRIPTRAQSSLQLIGGRSAVAASTMPLLGGHEHQPAATCPANTAVGQHLHVIRFTGEVFDDYE